MKNNNLKVTMVIAGVLLIGVPKAFADEKKWATLIQKEIKNQGITTVSFPIINGDFNSQEGWKLKNENGSTSKIENNSLKLVAQKERQIDGKVIYHPGEARQTINLNKGYQYTFNVDVVYNTKLTRNHVSVAVPGLVDEGKVTAYFDKEGRYKLDFISSIDGPAELIISTGSHGNVSYFAPPTLTVSNITATVENMGQSLEAPIVDSYKQGQINMTGKIAEGTEKLRISVNGGPVETRGSITGENFTMNVQKFDLKAGDKVSIFPVDKNGVTGKSADIAVRAAEDEGGLHPPTVDTYTQGQINMTGKIAEGTEKLRISVNGGPAIARGAIDKEKGTFVMNVSGLNPQLKAGDKVSIIPVDATGVNGTPSRMEVPAQ